MAAPNKRPATDVPSEQPVLKRVNVPMATGELSPIGKAKGFLEISGHAVGEVFEQLSKAYTQLDKAEEENQRLKKEKAFLAADLYKVERNWHEVLTDRHRLQQQLNEAKAKKTEKVMGLAKKLSSFDAQDGWRNIFDTLQELKDAVDETES